MSTLVNVCGMSRAGTTMLHLMLANGPEAFACGEIYAWFRPWRLNHFRTRCACGNVACPVWRGLADSTEDTFHRRVLEAPGVDFVVECSKRSDWIVDASGWANAAQVAVCNVLIWKEPRELAYSYWRRGRYDSWRPAFLQYYRTLLATGLRLRAICYTDLVQSPAHEVSSLCEEIGIPYRAGRERFWTGEHHYLFGSGGVRRQLRAGASSIKAVGEFPPEFRRLFDRDNRDQDREVRALQQQLRSLEG